MNINTLLLDRDGTLIEERHYLSDPDGVTLLPGAEALARWKAGGGRIFLVSNQSGIGRGYFTEADLAACTARLRELLRRAGADLDGARHCPHAPGQACSCRKPETGMWESLREEFGLQAARSAMVGDKREDLGLAWRAGLACAFLVLTGHGPESAEKLGLALAPGQDWAEPAHLPALMGELYGPCPADEPCRLFIVRHLHQVLTCLENWH